MSIANLMVNGDPRRDLFRVLQSTDTSGSGEFKIHTPVSARELSQKIVTVNDFGIGNFVEKSLAGTFRSYDQKIRLDHVRGRQTNILSTAQDRRSTCLHNDHGLNDIRDRTFVIDTEKDRASIFLSPGGRISDYYPEIEGDFEKLERFVKDFFISDKFKEFDSSYQYEVISDKGNNRVEVKMKNAQANLERAWGQTARIANDINAALLQQMPDLKIDFGNRAMEEIDIWPAPGEKTFAKRLRLVGILRSIATKNNLLFDPKIGESKIEDGVIEYLRCSLAYDTWAKQNKLVVHHLAKSDEGIMGLG